MSVFVTLIEKGIPFEIKTVDLDVDENKKAYVERQWQRVSVQEWMTRPRR